MPMLRFNPMWEFDNLTKEMEKMMKNFSSPIRVTRRQVFVPKVDILEEDNNIRFLVEVPGVKKDEVKISVNDENILTIKGEKKFEKKDEVNSCCRQERLYGEFSRSFRLPDMVDTEKIKASYENGVLMIDIVKMIPVKPEEKEIEIA